MLLVGDSKLISYANAAAMCQAGTFFVAPAGASKVPDHLYAALDPATAHPVDYTAARDRGKPPEQRGTYRVLEDTHTLTGRRKSDPPVVLRRILVHSSANATAQATARELKLARAREDLERLQRGLGGPHYKTAEKVTARIAVITKQRRIGPYLRAAVDTDPDTGRPTLEWSFDQEMIQAEQAIDGWYALLTNLPAKQASAEQVFLHYKGQSEVERRYSEVKGPLAVAPMFLHHNRRIAALITVICLALLVYCLMERQVRQALGDQQTMRGLYGYGPDRAARPTGRLILETLSELRLQPGTATDPPRVLVNRGAQAELLELLDIDPTRPRWPDSPFRTCEMRG